MSPDRAAVFAEGTDRQRQHPLRKPRGGILPTRYEALAALASGILFAFAFPPFEWVVPALVCLVPIAVAVARFADCDGHGWNAARMGFWFGVVGYGANVYWVAVALLLYTKLALLGYLATLMWLAPLVGMMAVVLFFARRLTGWPLAVLLPVVWVALEVLLNYLSDLSFPWLPLGLSVAHTPILAQVADLSGVRGVSFWIAASNGLLADAWLWKHDRVAAVKLRDGGRGNRESAIVRGVRSVAHVVHRTHTVGQSGDRAAEHPGRSAKLNVEDPTAHVAILTEMTRYELRHNAPQLVLWPEAALDQFLWRYPAWRDSLRSSAAGTPTQILTGLMDSDDPTKVPISILQCGDAHWAVWAPQQPADVSQRIFGADRRTGTVFESGVVPRTKLFWRIQPWRARAPFYAPVWQSGGCSSVTNRFFRN